MRNRTLMRAARALLFTSALALLLVSAPKPAPAAQREPSPACVQYCQLQLFDCYSQFGVDAKECRPVYRNCLAHCKL